MWWQSEWEAFSTVSFREGTLFNAEVVDRLKSFLNHWCQHQHKVASKGIRADKLCLLLVMLHVMFSYNTLRWRLVRTPASTSLLHKFFLQIRIKTIDCIKRWTQLEVSKKEVIIQVLVSYIPSLCQQGLQKMDAKQLNMTGYKYIKEL